MKLETELNIALTEFLRPIVAQCVQEAVQKISIHSAITPDPEPYGDFKWLAATCSGVPTSTLRIKTASGEIPSKRFGKRVLYSKTEVLAWIDSHPTRKPSTTAELEQIATKQISQQLSKKGGIVA